jgi:hypothetical protein
MHELHNTKKTIQNCKAQEILKKKKQPRLKNLFEHRKNTKRTLGNLHLNLELFIPWYKNAIVLI